MLNLVWVAKPFRVGGGRVTWKKAYAIDSVKLLCKDIVDAVSQ